MVDPSLKMEVCKLNLYQLFSNTANVDVLHHLKLVESLSTLNIETATDTPYPVNAPRADGFYGSASTSGAYILSKLRMGRDWCGRTMTTYYTSSSYNL